MVMIQRRQPVFDDSPDISEMGQIQLMPGLSDAEIIEAEWMANYTKGLMLVTGDPGSGKDLFANVFAWKLKRYFGKEVLRDEPPRELFGDYIPFDRAIIADDLNAMQEIATEKYVSDKVKTFRMSTIARDWLDGGGSALLQNKILYLTEFSDWVYHRYPMSPSNIFTGQILRRWRHLDLLVIGTTQAADELDKKNCLQFVSHQVRCAWSLKYPNVANYTIAGVRSITPQGVVNVSRKTRRYRIDGNAEREQLDGKRYFDLFNSKSKGIH